MQRRDGSPTKNKSKSKGSKKHQQREPVPEAPISAPSDESSSGEGIDALLRQMELADAAAAASTGSADDPVTALSITDEEKEKRLGRERLRREFSVESRPFLASVFEAMDCQENDYLALFALCLVYALQQNGGRRR